MLVDVYNLDGKKIETLELNDAVFNLEPNSAATSLTRRLAGHHVVSSAVAAAGTCE